MDDKTENWIAELGLLSQIATSEPKVAYIFFFFFFLQVVINVNLHTI